MSCDRLDYDNALLDTGPMCQGCGKRIRAGERRRRCTVDGCNRLVGLCCQGDVKPFTCSICWAKGHHIRACHSANHQQA